MLGSKRMSAFKLTIHIEPSAQYSIEQIEELVIAQSDNLYFTDKDIRHNDEVVGEIIKIELDEPTD